MDTLQITNAIRNISPTNRFFKGCYYNRNIPFHLMKERECFFYRKHNNQHKKYGSLDIILY